MSKVLTGCENFPMCEPRFAAEPRIQAPPPPQRLLSDSDFLGAAMDSSKAPSRGLQVRRLRRSTGRRCSPELTQVLASAATFPERPALTAWGQWAPH